MKKEDVVEALNEFFGFEVKWEKLSRDELMKIYEFLNDPAKIISRLIELMGIEEFVKTANNTILHKIVDERPIRKLLKELLLGR